MSENCMSNRGRRKNRRGKKECSLLEQQLLNVPCPQMFYYRQLRQEDLLILHPAVTFPHRKKSDKSAKPASYSHFIRKGSHFLSPVLDQMEQRE